MRTHREDEIARSLYICYFGVREPLVRTQVLPYLKELIRGGHELTLLTFEPDLTEAESGPVREELAAAGIDWEWLRYHKRPSVPATLFDVVNGVRSIRKLHSKKPFDIFHSRSHVPMTMAALARRSGSRLPRLLFDIRGFFPEEYVDAGLWPANGVVYRLVKRLERWLMQKADAFVVLTETAAGLLFPDRGPDGSDGGGRPVRVIPCCVDPDRFRSPEADVRDEMRQELALGSRFVLAYVGALGGWYLTEETARFFGELKRRIPDAFAMILTQSDPKLIRPLLEAEGLTDADMLIRKVSSDEIPRYLVAADAGISFIKECYSKKASSPTKNAEYLASGLPIVANAGIGDVDSELLEDKTGIVVTDLTDDGLAEAVMELEELLRSDGLAARCKESARRRYDLHSVGGERYRGLYNAIVAEGAKE